ncbi:MAG: transporter substrate-binding domain-containing protein [Oscillospiraceae bacterium]|nr:transporter substrate-binding domain-containing protein [Oscillospiraceae bacterium]
MKKRITCIAVISAQLCLILLGFTGCKRERENSVFPSFLDVPGITAEEVAAITALQRKYDSFTYAMPSSIEAFFNEDGEIKGFAVLFCNWLTELFDIEFVLEEYQFGEILTGLEDGSIDFTGTMTLTSERREKYIMTEPIAERTLKYFRIEESVPIKEIRETRLPRYGMLKNSVVTESVTANLEDDFEYIPIDDYYAVYDMLKNGEIDAYIHENHTEAVFVGNHDIVSSDFLPVVISPVSFTAQNVEFKPIIDVVQKALDSNGADFLTDMYNEGYTEYLTHILLSRLTPEERDYLWSEPTVYFGAEYYNYPLSFYNTHDKKWDGVVFDVIEGLNNMTGIKFERINDRSVPWYELFTMLENDEVSFVTELLHSKEREGLFIWPDTPILTDKYALLSRSEHRDIGINEVYNIKVGLTEGSTYAELFHEWFPDHKNYINYNTYEEIITAFERGEIDMVMLSERWLLTMTNYHELSGYKINLVFDKHAESYLGFNRNETVLCSIVNKYLSLIDVNDVTVHWTNKTYDYRLKMAHARLPWLIGASILLICVIILMFILFQRKRTEEHRLEKIIDECTKEWEKQTSILKSVFDSSPDLMFCMDLDFNYVQINKRMEEHFNVIEKDVIGKRDGEILGVPADVLKKMLDTDKTVLTEKTAVMVEELVPNHKGDEVYFDTTKVPLWLGDEMIGILGTAHDVTLRKNMEEEIKAASRYKSAFLANMSHELRTPLNAIIGLTALMLEEENLPDEIRHNCESVCRSGNTLLSIVNDILDMSKIESGKLNLVPVEYHVPSIINDTSILINTYIGEKPIVFKLNINASLPGVLYGDEIRIKQIMNNLLSNAVKYTDEGVVELSISCERVVKDKALLTISVKDTGMGIKPDDVARLFEVYSRVDMESNRKKEGTGLGLSITRQLAEMMGGGISVESEYGSGSVFTVKFYQGLVNDTVIGETVSENLKSFKFNDDKQVAHKIVRTDLSHARVLIVDDVQSNLDVATGLMKKYNLKIDCVLSGRAAIDKIKNKNAPVYNAIFMDHMMPEMDGIETANVIRAIGTEYAKNVPIIALTANAISGTEKLFFDNDFQDFLTKPIDIHRLDAVMKKWLRVDLEQVERVVKEPDGVKANTDEIVIPGIDVAKTLSLFGGSVEIFLTSIRSYASHSPALLDKLRSVTEETVKDIGVINAHGLKGSSSNISAENIRADAAVLEAVSRTGDFVKFKELSQPLIQQTEQLIERINSWLNEYDAKNGKQSKNAPDVALLEKLCECCRNYDMSGIDEVMDELEEHSYDDDPDLVPWLRDKVDTMDLDSVIDRLSSMKG